MTVTAQETVTLPEGAIVTIAKCEEVTKKSGLKRSTILSACRNGEAIEMKVDDISSQNVRQYLKMVVREINRRRSAMAAKPLTGCSFKPKTIPDFVTAMALNDMFCLDVLEATKGHMEQETAAILGEKKPRRRKASKKAPVKANGNLPV